MKIFVVGSSKNKFLPLDNIREKFLVDQKHEGDNIDFLNPWYCELTGLYYLWKHCDDDIVGLEHYRRYFVNDKGNLLSESEIREILKEHDVICKKWVFKEHRETNGMTYWHRSHREWYLEKFISLIDDKNLRNFIKSKLQSQPYFYQCNMFIGKNEIYKKYAEWLFETLFKLKSKDFCFCPRIIGYIGEFCFGFWLQYHGYKIKAVNVNVFNQNLSYIIRNG